MMHFHGCRFSLFGGLGHFPDCHTMTYFVTAVQWLRWSLSTGIMRGQEIVYILRGGHTLDTLFEKYKSLCIDGSLISLENGDLSSPYFCYPVNAKVIGFEGCILYCAIAEYGEMIFASNPESCADKNVYPLAKNFSDFMRLILACGSTNPVEQIVWMDKEQFEQHMQDERAIQTGKQKAVLLLLSKELELSPIENPFEYVKAI